MIFGATDPKAGGPGSVLGLLAQPQLDHRSKGEQGLLAGECAELLQRLHVATRDANH